MKRNSKRFLALFLSVAMTVTPAVLTQAENEDTNVQVSVTPTPETEAEKTAVAAETPVQENATAEEENTDTTVTPAAVDASAVKETPAATETPASETTPEVTASPAEESKNEEAEAPQPTAAPETTEEGKTEETDKPETKPEDLNPDGSNMTIDKEDNSAYKMLKIKSSSAELNGDKIKITLNTDGKNYEKLYLGSKEDPDEAKNAAAIVGTENEDGYTFIFEVPASEQVQTFSIVPFSVKNQKWYTNMALKLNVPGMKAPEPTATPEPTAAPEPTATPLPTAAPTQAPAQNEITDAGIKLVKENGDEFVMFVITGSTVKVSEDKYIVTLSTAKQNYDMIYLGSASDSDKEANSIKGVENSAGGYTYTFEVTASKEAQTIAVVPHSKKSQNWYAKGILTITVPAVPGYGEAAPTPEPTVSPEPTEAPVETPAPTETPVPSTTPEATTTPEPTATPAPGSCASGIYNITVNSSSSMFRVIDCVLTSKNGKMTAVLTLSGTGYDYLCLGTKEEAAAADSSTWVPYVADANGKYTYEIPVEALDNGIAVAAFSHKNQIWYDRILTFQSSTLNKIGDVQDDPQPDTAPDTTITATPAPTAKPNKKPTATPTPTATPKPDKKPEEESKYESDLSGGTASVNSSTTLADGTYTPDSFSWSGGSGKVSISCNKVTVTNGQAYATIVFSSEYYGYVKANGNKYYGACGGGTSTFTIPVALNQNNTIIGMTTRMSQAHEITYTIYIALKGANDPKKTDKDNPADDNSMLSTGNKKLDDSAPEITGLEYKDETTLEHAKYFKLYHYAKGITLLEVDMTTDTARKPETVDSGKENAKTEAADSQELTGTEKLYIGNVVKYLIVPEGAVIPAGLDKDVIVINQPVESAYVASTDALNILDKLDLTDKVTALGMEKEDCTVDSLTAALEDGSVTFAGKDEDTDYKALVKSQCGISILSSDILPTEEADTEAKENLLKDSAEKYSTLKIPFIVDRSADEKDDNAKAEWEKAYEAIFVTDEEE